MPQGEGTYGSQVGRPPKKDSPLEYTPFKMKAKDYGNSPMRKNFGIGDSEMPIKTESPGKSTDDSPTKFKGGRGRGGLARWVREKTAAANAKRAAASGGDAAAAAPAEAMAAEAADPTAGGGGDPMAAEAADPAGDPAATEGAGAVAPHGPEAHTGGGAVGTPPPPKGKWARRKWKRNRRQRELNQRYPGMKTRSYDGPQGGGGFGGTVGGGMGNMFSDIRLKEKIQKTGDSPSGIPIYEFNYIGGTNRYSGAMAQDLLEINPDAVSMDTSGYYKVNYNDIDVDMHLLN